MAEEPPNPHDAYFRQVMSRPADAAGELRAVLPEAVTARLDWETLALQPCSFISQQLRSRFSDVLLRTRLDGHHAFVYILIEHQSRPDRLMAFRMLEYMVGIWSRHLEDNPNSKALPAIIPLVVHASPQGRRWKYSTELADLIDLDPTAKAALRAYLPEFQFLLDDLTAVDVPALCARDLTSAARMLLVLLKTASGNTRLSQDLLPRAEDLRLMVGTPDFECLVTYILIVGDTSVADLGPLIDLLGPRAKEVIMTTADKLRAEGRTEGRAEGRADSLLDLLSLKFGPLPDNFVARVRAADLEQLRAWTARVLTAGSLAEVFGQ